MNAAEDLDVDEGLPVPPEGTSQGLSPTPASTFRWSVPLDPGLRMGLDFDLSGEAELVVPVESPFLEPDAELRAELIVAPQGARSWWGWDDDTPRVAIFESDPVELSPGSRHTFTLTSPIDPGVDVVEHRQGQNLLLVLSLTSARPNAFLASQSPNIMPGGTLRLPLHEYHDPVEELFAGDRDGVRLAAVGDAQRLANPGALVRFPVDLTNPGSGTRFDLQVLGLHAEHVRLSASSLRVDKEGTARFHVLAEVPEELADGERIDVVVQATGGEDLPALLRLVVEADTQEEHPDDRAEVEFEGDAEDAPAPLLVPVLLLALFLASRRVRRRQL